MRFGSAGPAQGARAYWLKILLLQTHMRGRVFFRSARNQVCRAASRPTPKVSVKNVKTKLPKSEKRTSWMDSSVQIRAERTTARRATSVASGEPRTDRGARDHRFLTRQTAYAAFAAAHKLSRG